MDGCGVSTSRILISILNIIFWVFAAGLFYLSAYIFSEYGDYGSAISVRYMIAPGVVLIVVGVFLFVTSIIGCCGVFRDHKCLLGTFFGLVLFIFLLEVLTGTLGFVYKDKVSDSIHDEITTLVDDYNGTSSDTPIDFIQNTGQCCGVFNYTDWADTDWGFKHPGLVPTSCCLDTVANCTGNLFDLDSINQEGCYSMLNDLFHNNFAYIAATGIGFAAILFIVLVSTCVLMCRSREDVPYINITGELRA